MNRKRLLVYLIVIIGVLLLTFLNSREVEGGGTGDWPYGSGAWLITTDTHVWDETVTVTDFVDVGPGITLTLDNVTLTAQGPGIEVRENSNLTLQDESSLVCNFIFLYHTSTLSIYDSTAESLTTMWYIGAWGENATIDINQSAINGLYGSFVGATSILFRNSTFDDVLFDTTEAIFDFYSCDVVLVTQCEFTNMSDTLFLFYQCPDVDIIYSDFLSCQTIFTHTNSTIGYGGNRILYFLHVAVQDMLRQPVGGADVVIFDTDETQVYSGSTASDGYVSWIQIVEVDGYEDMNPYDIVVSRLGNWEEISLSIRRNQTVTVRISDFRQMVKVAVEMRNNYTKEKIPFGNLLCFINLPEGGELDDDYYIFDWENYIYYPTSYVNISVYDYFDRLVWYQNQTIDYTETRIEVIPYINFTTITITQHDADTNEPGEWIHEWNLTLDDGDISVHFEGDEFGVPEIEDGNNNYTLSWDETENYTAGSKGINNVTAETTYPPSTHEHKFTGSMVVDVGLQSKPTVISSESFWMQWFGWILPFLEGEGWIVLSAMITIIGFVYLLHRAGWLAKSEARVANSLDAMAKQKKNQRDYKEGKISEQKYRKKTSNIKKQFDKLNKRSGTT